MPRSYWRIILPIVGLVSLVVSGVTTWALYPEQIPLSGNTAVETVSAYDREQERSCEPSQIELLSRHKRQAKAEACAKSAAEHQEQSNSYIQARRGSDAAEASAVYAFEQARVAAVGAGLGLLTMFAAIAAAIFAAVAAVEATNAVGEARQANILTREENRPWLSIEISGCGGVQFVNGGMHADIRFVVKNQGGTVARRVSSSLQFKTGFFETHAYMRQEIARHIGTGAIGRFVPAGGEFTEYIRVPMHAELLNSFPADNFTPALVIETTYQSSFSDDVHVTIMCFDIGGGISPAFLTKGVDVPGDQVVITRGLHAVYAT